MPSAPALQVGLIGCGRIVQSVHLNALASLQDVRIVAVAEPDPERRAAAASRTGAAAYSDYAALLDHPAVEAVLIAAPNSLHAAAAVAAFERGKHVYLEKPLATSLAEGRAVLAAWRRSGALGVIGFNYRFHPLHQELRAALQARRLGEPAGARSVFTTRLRPRPEWKQARFTGGGVLLDLASHHIDLARYLLSCEVCEVFARLRSQHSEDDSATLELCLEGGLLMQSFFSMSAVEEDRFEVYGPDGKLTVDRYRPTRLGARLRRWLAPGREPSYELALASFIAAARSGFPAGPDLLDGYRALEVIAAAEKSARTGQAVPVSRDEAFALA